MMLCDALKLRGRIKKLSEAHVARTAARLQCGADGEEALEAILTYAACVCALLALLQSAA